MRVTKEDLILSIARQEKIKIDTVRSVYNALERIVFETITSTKKEDTKDNPVEIRLFEGINLNSYYEPEKEVKLNYVKDETQNDTILVKGKIKLKTHITRNLKKKINRN